jgi:hypothetical protein
MALAQGSKKPHDIGPESRPHLFDFVEKTPI